MRQYYQDAFVTLYHGDCREVLPGLEAADLLITDPPYMGLTGGYSRPDGGAVGKLAQDSLAVGDPWSASLVWLPAALANVRLGAMLFCTYHSLAAVATALAPLRLAALITWHKRNAAPTGKNVPRFTEEYVWCAAKAPGLRWDAFTSTLIDIPNINPGCAGSPERIVGRNGRAFHPTQKPLAVMRRLLSVQPASIIDPFAGTGTTLVAAKGLGIRSVGVEIEESNCEIAVQRLSQEVLWDAPGAARAT